MKSDPDATRQPPQRGDQQILADGANRLVAKVSRLYADASPDDQFTLGAWMRDIILGRKEGSVNMLHAKRVEKRMVGACERRILEFPLAMGARDVAKELKREGRYAWAIKPRRYCPSNRARAGKSGDLRNVPPAHGSFTR